MNSNSTTACSALARFAIWPSDLPAAVQAKGARTFASRLRNLSAASSMKCTALAKAAPRVNACAHEPPISFMLDKPVGDYGVDVLDRIGSHQAVRRGNRIMMLIDLFGGIAELWCSWRLYICLGIVVGFAVGLHNTFPDQAWTWFVSVPTVIIGIGFGFWWQIRADGK